MKLTDIEKNVLSMALSHMEEHIEDLIIEGDFPFSLRGLQEKLEACKNLQTKLL